MIRSMTGFASCHCELSSIHLNWILKSVNHRYLELQIKLPDLLQDWQGWVREYLQKNFTRGKIDVSLQLQFSTQHSVEMSINTPLLRALLAASQQVIEQIPSHAQLNVMDVLSWPELLQAKNQFPADLQTQAQQSLKTCVRELQQCRAREGQALADFITQQLQSILQIQQEIIERIPLQKQNWITKIQQSIQEAAISIDPTRFMQEQLWMLQKIDISEELQRLHTHCNEMLRILHAGNAAGKRLDFLCQECNREANTLTNKVTDTIIIQKGVDLKVLIDQIREQVQNIE